jgi:hypothetical protein
MPQNDANFGFGTPERFPAKACPALDAGWIPVRVKKRIKTRKRASVPIQSERFDLLD